MEWHRDAVQHTSRNLNFLRWSRVSVGNFRPIPPSLTPPNPPYPKLDAIPSNFFNASNFWPISIEINKRRFIPHRRRKVGCFYCSCRDFKRFGCGFCMIFFLISPSISEGLRMRGLKWLWNCSETAPDVALRHIYFIRIKRSSNTGIIYKLRQKKK